MPATTIRAAPSVADFTPLSEHQSRTPETFFGGKPVLHAHVVDATAWLPSSERPGLSAVFPSESGTAANQDDVLEQKVDLFAATDYVTLFNHSTDSGIQIPYPMIALHAVKNVNSPSEGDPKPAIYMQLIISPDEDEFETASLTLIPPEGSTTTAEIFTAISDCADLHPDPVAEEGDENEPDRIVFEPPEAIEGYSGVFSGASDGGLPPPMPGSGGWITADNVQEYFDSDGNFIGNRNEGTGETEDLGEGAGRVRAREEAEADDNHVNGTKGDTESKRPRVE